MVGNFMGDAIKGNSFDEYPEQVARGIHFHRFIDSFTDQHPEVKASKALMRPSQGKYSGVVVDVLFDHLLALHWSEYHDDSLESFAAECYRVVRSRYDLLPLRAERFFGYMTANNILPKYASRQGIRKVLQGMDSRTPYASNMQEAIDTLPEHYSALDVHFQQFFPELKAATEAWKKEH